MREEMNRADQLKAGEGRRGNTVGFALTVLQRRLAPVPEAIYQLAGAPPRPARGRERGSGPTQRGADILAVRGFRRAGRRPR